MCRHKRVAFLECDVGQTEFTPSGVVSMAFVTQPLIGNANTCWFCMCFYLSVFRASQYTPAGSRKVCLGASLLLNWLYMLSSRRAYFIGDNSPMQQPDLYVCSINSLIEYFISRKEPMPLIVNTCGWLRGRSRYSLLNIHTQLL